MKYALFVAILAFAGPALAQANTQPGGTLGPGGPWVPQQANDAGSVMISGGPVSAQPQDGGFGTYVCVQSDCAGNPQETRFLFSCQANPSNGNLAACLPVAQLSHIVKGASPKYVITDIALEAQTTAGCVSIEESTTANCDGGVTLLYGTVCTGANAPFSQGLVTPIPLDPGQYICCAAGPTENGWCHVNGYLTAYTPRVTY